MSETEQERQRLEIFLRMIERYDRERFWAEREERERKRAEEIVCGSAWEL